MLEGNHMQTNIIKLQKTSKYIGIELKPEELDLLKIVYDLKIINTRNVHNFYLARSKSQKSKQVITNRIHKLRKAGLLFRLDDSHIASSEFRPTNFYLRISSRGLGILKDNMLISQSEYDISMVTIYHIKIPQPHNEAVTTVVMDLILHAYIQGKPLNPVLVELSRGEYSKAVIDAGPRLTEGELIPDFVFETRNQLICLELDTGNQILSVLQSKINRYKEMALVVNKPLTLIFSVGLKTMNAVNTSTKQRRVSSIKELFISIEDLPKTLEVFVVETNRATELIYKQIFKKHVFEERHRKGRVLEWLVHSMEAAPSGTVFAQSKNELFETTLNKDDYDLDVPGEIIFPNQEANLVGFIYMEEGSVRSFLRARKNIERIERVNRLLLAEEKPVSVFLIYEEEEHALNDIIGIMPKCSVWMISIQKVLDAARLRENEYPTLLKINTQFTKVEGKLI